MEAGNMKYVKVYVSLPEEWPWDALEFLSVGVVTKEPRAVELPQQTVEWLKVKGLKVAEVKAKREG